MRTHLIAPIVIFSACASDAATTPAPPAKAPPSKTLEARVAALADGPGAVFMALGESPAVYMAWDEQGRSHVEASCTAGDAFALGVFTRANAAAKDGVNCDGNVCVHYGADELRTAFVFRPDGSLAGVLANVETSDAAGTDDEVAQMKGILASVLCPASDLSLDGVKLDTTAD